MWSSDGRCRRGNRGRYTPHRLSTPCVDYRTERTHARRSVMKAARHRGPAPATTPETQLRYGLTFRPTAGITEAVASTHNPPKPPSEGLMCYSQLFGKTVPMQVR